MYKKVWDSHTKKEANQTIMEDTFMKENKDADKPDFQAIDQYEDEFCNSCSATDCTGLIPSAPITDMQLNSYMDLYHFRAEVDTKIKEH